MIFNPAPDDKFELTFQVEYYKDEANSRSRVLDAFPMSLRPYCPKCNKYAVRVCQCENSQLCMHSDLVTVEGEFRDERGAHVAETQLREMLEEDRKKIWEGKV